MKPYTVLHDALAIQKILDAYGCQEPLPTYKTQVVIAFPPQYDYRLARVIKTRLKSTYGKPLYQLELTA
jgi:hypothetical protein